MEAEGSLPCSQQTVIYIPLLSQTYPERTVTSSFSVTHFLTCWFPL